MTQQPLGKSRKAEPSSEDRGGCEGLTQHAYKCKVLHHDIKVQVYLNLIKKTPFLPGEVHGHILKGHTALRWVHQRRRCHRILCAEWSGDSPATGSDSAWLLPTYSIIYIYVDS